MKVQIGKIKLDKVENQQIKPNRTRKYLLPCLKEYGKDFMYRLNNVFKVAVGIGDMIVIENGVKVYEKHLFILIDTNIATGYFLEFIDWIKDQPQYEDDYVVGNIQKSTLHMVVIRFPDKYYDSFDSFKLGKYSKMFSQETINTFFEKYPDAQKVFIKDRNYKIIYTRRVNRYFNMTGIHALKPDDWEPDEYDMPPNPREEIFNHHLKK